MVPGGRFEYMALYWYTLYTRKQEMKKLRAGFLLKDLLNRAEEKANGRLTPDRNLWMYFAHDTTISSLLDTLSLFDKVWTLFTYIDWHFSKKFPFLRFPLQPHVPTYASCLVFQLYKGHDLPYMELVYRKSHEDIEILNIPGCGQKCSLKKWRETYDRVIPKHSFTDECKLHRGEKLPRHGNPENRHTQMRIRNSKLSKNQSVYRNVINNARPFTKQNITRIESNSLKIPVEKMQNSVRRLKVLPEIQTRKSKYLYHKCRNHVVRRKSRGKIAGGG